jgi:16S rRNA (adenine1518-N6/adenine1519-N6)-dimethyltransferase
MTRQRLGQHFLRDDDWRVQIAQAIGLGGGSAKSAAEQEFCWIEVGGGHGEMTRYLVDTGRPVHVLELDKGLIAGLERLAKQHANLKVVPGDVLQADLREIAAGLRMRIFGNLPYYITSPILHHFFTFAAEIDAIHIAIQKEVAERLVAEPGGKEYGYLSVLTQFYSWPSLALEIPRSAFDPPPEVDSQLVSLRLPGLNAQLGLKNEEEFLEFVKRSFAQKRKMLTNNLRGEAAPERVRELLKERGLREDARAEALSVQDFAFLFSALGQG